MLKSVAQLLRASLQNVSSTLNLVKHAFDATKATTDMLLKDFIAPTSQVAVWKDQKPAPMPKEKSFFAGCSYNGKIYTAGGCTPKGKALDCVFEYDPLINTWRELAGRMNVKRQMFASSTIGDTIYVAGGSDGSGTLLTSVECLDLSCGFWSQTTAFIGAARSSMVCSAVDTKIFMSGGTLGDDPTDQVQIFDSLKKTWKMSSGLKGTRRNHISESLGETIYVAGGWRPRGCLKTCEIINARTEQWIAGADLPEERRCAASSVLDSSTIIISGGSPGGQQIVPPDVLIFDPRKRPGM
eukprot:TRINITY_DN9320_c0_g1_i1.p1 TRINITY_DN9320_c0_g1~~TRINITY_DN9320_c0_g1_i1.p1  ORF type:complete len:297 (+),score=35.99 TRINITY_DN9320_c0_g1_i1:38-928(+)